MSEAIINHTTLGLLGNAHNPSLEDIVNAVDNDEALRDQHHSHSGSKLDSDYVAVDLMRKLANFHEEAIITETNIAGATSDCNNPGQIVSEVVWSSALDYSLFPDLDTTRPCKDTTQQSIATLIEQKNILQLQLETLRGSYESQQVELLTAQGLAERYAAEMHLQKQQHDCAGVELLKKVEDLELERRTWLEEKESLCQNLAAVKAAHVASEQQCSQLLSFLGHQHLQLHYNEKYFRIARSEIESFSQDISLDEPRCTDLAASDVSVQCHNKTTDNETDSGLDIASVRGRDDFDANSESTFDTRPGNTGMNLEGVFEKSRHLGICVKQLRENTMQEFGLMNNVLKNHHASITHHTRRVTESLVASQHRALRIEAQLRNERNVVVHLDAALEKSMRARISYEKRIKAKLQEQKTFLDIALCKCNGLAAELKLKKQELSLKDDQLQNAAIAKDTLAKKLRHMQQKMIAMQQSYARNIEKFVTSHHLNKLKIGRSRCENEKDNNSSDRFENVLALA